MKKYCVIVDPYISASLLCQTLNEMDIPLIAVLSDLNIDEELKQKRLPTDKFEIIIDSKQAANVLDDLSIARVIPGYDSSVELADQLALKYCPSFANPVATSLSRYDKSYSQDAVKKANLPYIKGFVINDKKLSSEQLNEISTWQWPLIAKPTSGNSSFGMSINYSLEELQENITICLNKQAPIGNAINSMLIQEFITGDEYFIDTVSLNGHHKIVSIFRYKKTKHGASLILRYAELVDANSAEGKICIDYIKKVLDAVEYYNGIAHTEIMLTKEHPYLIEINPRMSGVYGLANKLAQLANNRSQDQLFGESVLDPQSFIKSYSDDLITKQHGMLVILNSWETRQVGDLNKAALEKLPSYIDAKLIKDPGSQAHAPTSLFDAVAFVLLSNSNQQQLMDDYQKLEEMERNHQLF